MKKNTLTKLVALATVLLVSVGTIAGSTVAWFTDTEYAINTIQSGSLDVGLEYWGPTVDEDGEETIGWADVESDTQIFKQGALYEPGYTEVVFLRVSNLGDLDLKYKLAVQAADTQTGESLIEDPVEKNTVLELSDYLKVAAFEVEKAKADESSDATFETAIENWNKATENGDGTTTSARAKVRAEIEDTVSNLDPTESNIPFLSKGTALKDSNGEPVVNSKDFPIYEVDLFKNEDGSAKTFNLLAAKDATDTTASVAAGENVIGLVLYMPEEVGNEANNRGTNKPEIEIGIFLEAAQMMSEEDSYDNTYDEEASFASTNLNTVDRTTGSDDTTTGGTTLEPEEFIVDGIIYRTVVENGVVLDVVEVAGYNPNAEEIPDTVTIGSYIDAQSNSAQALADYITKNNPEANFADADSDINIWRVANATWPTETRTFVLDQETGIFSNAFPTGSTIDIPGGWNGDTIPTDAFSVDIKQNTEAKYVVHFGFGEDSNFEHTAWDGSSLKSALDAADYIAGTHYTVEFSDGWVINKGAVDPMPAVITEAISVTAGTAGIADTSALDSITDTDSKAVKVERDSNADETATIVVKGLNKTGIKQVELPAGNTKLDVMSLPASAEQFVLIVPAGASISYDSGVTDGDPTGPFGSSTSNSNRFFLYTGTDEGEMSTLWSGLSSVGFTNAYYYDVKNNVYTHYETVTMP